jgi:arylsulfatase A-like enzyme
MERGGQTIEDTGPLTKKRMETIDREITDGALDFIERQTKADKPFFCWWNSTRMHVWTHLKEESKGKTGLGVYPDGMVEHDGHVGELLAKLDELGIADNTIVMYSTDNGAEKCSWPDGGSTPFRGEKASNWEGGWRVPTAIRWPGVIKPGTVSNEICSHQDMLPTLVAAAGEPDIVEKCKKGYKAGDKTFKVHLDGFNLIPYLKGEVAKGPRPGFLYWGDEGDLMALRYGNWKIHFAEQTHEGFAAWEQPLLALKFPKLFNLRSDPFEEADISGDVYYKKWRADRVFMLLPAGALVAQYMQTMIEFPPRQSPDSWSPEAMMEKLKKNAEALKAAAHAG